MLYSCINAIHKNNPAFWYEQTRNTTEQTNKKLINEIVAALKKKYNIVYKYGNLETCGASASANCQAAVGKLGQNREIVTFGGYKPQLDSMIADYMNNPNNYDELKKCGYDPWSVQGTRVFAAYPLAVKAVFGNICTLVFRKTWGEAIYYLKERKSIQMCFKSPGHYFAVIEYDSDTNRFTCIDSWKARTGSHLFYLTEPEYRSNTWDRFLVYE